MAVRVDLISNNIPALDRLLAFQEFNLLLMFIQILAVWA